MEVKRSVYREDHEMLRETARRFFERECLPRQAQWDEAGCVDRETWLKAGREGLLCVTVPEEYGGGGGDFGHSAIVAEELHRSGVSGFSYSVHSDITAPYIVRLGTEEQKRRWLPAICRGEKILAIAMTEPGTGSDLKSIRTTAVRDGDDFVINGSKTFISNGLNCDLVVLVCKTDPSAGAKGVSLIVVETDREGFRRGRKLREGGPGRRGHHRTVLRQRARAGGQPARQREQGLHPPDGRAAAGAPDHRACTAPRSSNASSN